MIAQRAGHNDWTTRSAVPITIGALTFSLLLGIAISKDSRLAILPLAPFVLLAILRSPQFRLAFVTMGGIFTLQSSDGFNPTKLGYLLGVGACGVLSLYSLRDPRNQELKHYFNPIFPWLVIWSFVVIVSSLAAQRLNVPTSDWMRGAIPYALFAAIPIVVFDAVKNTGSYRIYEAVRWLFIAAGVLCAISWAIAWTARRGYGSFGIERLFLWSFLLPAALFCYSISAAFHSPKHRTVWVALAFFTFGMFALTGTRSSLLFGVGPIVLFLLNSRASVRRGPSMIIPLALSVALLLGFFIVVADYINLDTTTVTERFSALTDFESVEAGDASYQERSVQTELAKMAFRRSPWIGVSPGFRYQWFLPTGELKSSFNIDTAFALPANFGLLGVGAAIVTFTLLIPFVRSLTRFGAELATERDALKCFAVLSLASFWMGSPFEDKGFSYAFMFLLSLILIKVRILTEAGYQREKSFEDDLGHPASEKPYQGEGVIPGLQAGSKAVTFSG